MSGDSGLRAMVNQMLSNGSVSETSFIRAALPTPLSAITPAEAIAAVIAKAATL